MKKIFLLLLLSILFGCSSDNTIVEEEVSTNSPPTISPQTFEINENEINSTSIGFVTAEDIDGDKVIFKIDISEKAKHGVIVDSSTGELKISDASLFDFETNKELTIPINVFDAESQARADIKINILDVDDGLLTNEQKRFVRDFKTIVLANYSGLSGNLNKWKGSIKIYLSGSIPNGYSEQVTAQNEILNVLMTDGTKIEVVDTLEESNVHLFFGRLLEIKEMWPAMWQSGVDNNAAGVAQIPEIDENYNNRKGRIWVSGDSEELYYHELGHVLGFGHSGRCDYVDINNISVMCGSVLGIFSPFDEDLMHFAYHPMMKAGFTSVEIDDIYEKIITGDTSGKNGIFTRKRNLTSSSNGYPYDLRIVH